MEEGATDKVCHNVLQSPPFTLWILLEVDLNIKQAI